MFVDDSTPSEGHFSRRDTLKLLHAQSSADTSGLGDSLQRIHGFSSFDSSGYGDTEAPPTCHSPSPDLLTDCSLATVTMDNRHAMYSNSNHVTHPNRVAQPRYRGSNEAVQHQPMRSHDNPMQPFHGNEKPLYSNHAPKAMPPPQASRSAGRNRPAPHGGAHYHGVPFDSNEPGPPHAISANNPRAPRGYVRQHSADAAAGNNPGAKHAATAGVASSAVNRAASSEHLYAQKQQQQSHHRRGYDYNSQQQQQQQQSLPHHNHSSQPAAYSSKPHAAAAAAAAAAAPSGNNGHQFRSERHLDRIQEKPEYNSSYSEEHRGRNRSVDVLNDVSSQPRDSQTKNDMFVHEEKELRFDDIDQHLPERTRKPSLESYIYDAFQSGALTGGGGLTRSASKASLYTTDGARKPLSRSGSGQFLGASMQNSTWLKWSQDRRASFKRRLDALERRQKELEENRVSTPVMKARKESIMFSHIGMQDPSSMQQSEVDVNTKLAKYIPNGTIRKRGKLDNDANKLSSADWHALVAFWEHGLFVKARYTAIVIAFFSLILAIVSITNQQWSIFEGE